MQELNIEKFSPKKAELIELSEEAKGLQIKGVDDKAGYTAVHQQRMKLKNARVEITKTGKSLRADALAFQKAVIEREKELIAIIEPAEIDLENKQKTIDLEKEMLKRKSLLPERQSKLAEIDVVINDEFLLVMDDVKFGEFYNIKKEEFLAEKERIAKEEQEARERKIREEQEKLEDEKRKLEEEKRLEQARKEAEKRAKIEAEEEAERARKKAEEEKQRAIEEERRKAEEEKRQIIAEQERKDRERKEAEEKIKQEEAEKLRKQQEEAERVEKLKKYQKFLKDNGYTEETKDEFKIEREANKVILYKKLGQLTI